MMVTSYMNFRLDTQGLCPSASNRDCGEGEYRQAADRLAEEAGRLTMTVTVPGMRAALEAALRVRFVPGML
jgi:hypothetical protein